MSQPSDLGKLGEQLAAEHLRKKGYAIITQNFVSGKAEVDIIAGKDDKIIFVEVKTRESAYLSDPSLMVPMKKQKQIIKAADAYLKEFGDDAKPRFDIIAIVTNSDYTKINHIEDAFYPTL